MLKKGLAVLLTVSMVLLFSAASAETVTLNGTVVNIGEETVLSVYGGTVEEVLVRNGDYVHAGDVIATLKTRKVYALQDGTVRFFGETGESAEMITNQYGAVAYVEPAQMYTLSISTKTADTTNDENTRIHPGETVYLRVTSDLKRTGVGTVAQVAGGSFTVIISEGSFKSGDSVNAYRDPGFLSSTRLGKGSISLNDPIAYSDEGIVVSYAAANGDAVRKGDVLFELADGSYSGKGFGGTAITAPCDGVITQLNVSEGTAVEAGSAAAAVYPDEAQRVEALVSETDLNSLQPGKAVTIGFSFLSDGAVSVTGTVESISRLGDTSVEDSDEAWFSVCVKPDQTDIGFYGLHAIVWAE